MIKAYADDRLVYDSRLSNYALLELRATVSTEKGGMATITLPPGHPVYNGFTSYKTVVTVYRDETLLFRGRALYPSDDFYNQRTITCEGERCFLRDGVMRPYLYQDEPALIFEDIINVYNEQVDEFKRFKVGTVTVTDANNYVRLESGTAESCADTIDKLLERCGGYIVFTTNTEGERVINWYASLSYTCDQAIEFGENLLDFARSGANTDLATVIIPYGAEDEETGERVDITSIEPNGLDYVQDDEAIALRGRIVKPVYWDDVTEPQNLITKARQYLAEKKLFISSLELTAVDLSYLDKSIDSFRVGDLVQVKSKPHNVDDTFLLTTRTYDFLAPENDTVVLGKELTSLVGADVAGDRKNQEGVLKVEHNIKKDYQLNVAQAIQEATLTLTTLIEQTSQSIRTEVAEQYVTGDGLESLISSQVEQLSDSITFRFNQIQSVVDGNDAEMREQLDRLEKYVRIENGDVVIGEVGNAITLRCENDRISFLDGGAEVAYLSNKKLFVVDGQFLSSLQIGNFKWVSRSNGNVALIKVVT